MAARKQLHLVVPGICGPLAETGSLASDGKICNWIDRLSKAGCHAAPVSYYEVISELFGFDPEHDFPAAMFEMSASGAGERDRSYMCADPVHLQADMDHAILTGNEDISITEPESSALCSALDQHFSVDGIRFHYRDRLRWMVSSHSEISLSTTPLTDAVGRNVNFLLPRGDDARFWKQVMTEAQMLLYSHEVNNSRETRGIPAINSVWFYGSGKLPVERRASLVTVTGDSEMLKGMADHMDCDFSGLPDSASEYMQSIMEMPGRSAAVSGHLLSLSKIEYLTNYTDVRHWADQLGCLLDDWIMPVLSIARDNDFDVILYPCNGRRYHFSRYDALKFWRRGSLEQHISCY